MAKVKWSGKLRSVYSGGHSTTKRLNGRSTSCGDVIESFEGRKYVVAAIGFKEMD